MKNRTLLKKGDGVKKYFIWFLLLTKRELHHTFTLMLLILVPVCACIYGKIHLEEDNGTPLVGIMALDGDSIAADTVEKLLSANGNDAVTFYAANSLDELEGDIRAGSTDCGYVLCEGLGERLSRSSIKNTVTLYESPSSMMTSLANEMVFAAIYESMGATIANSFAANDETLSRLGDQSEYINERFNYYLDGPATFHIEFKSMETGLSEIEVKKTTFPLRGILSLLILLGGLMGQVRFLADRDNGVFTSRTRSFIGFGRITYTIIPVLLWGISALASLTLSGNWTTTAIELAHMGLYALMVVFVSVLLGLMLNNQFLLAAAIPVTIICCLLFCPIFIDLGSIIPLIKVVRKILPPYYYIKYFI
jgi:ABC-2 type transport system permease protein